MHAHALHTVVGGKLPAEIVAGDEVTQSRVEGRNVIILKIDLDEGLPVVIAGVHLDVVEDIVGKVEFRPRKQVPDIPLCIARPFKEQAVAVLELEPLQIKAGLFVDLGCPEQFSGVVVCPAMQRADDVAPAVAQVAVRVDVAGDVAGLAAQHDGLAVATDVGEQLDAVIAAKENAPAAFGRQGAPVAWLGDEFFVPDINGGVPENTRLLACQQRFVKIGCDWKLGTRRRNMRHPTNVGHDSLRTDNKASRARTMLARRKIGLADHHVNGGIVPERLRGR